MSGDWEPLGRELLQCELEKHGESLGTAFRDAATLISRGEDVADLELGQLRVRLKQAEYFLENVEEITESDK